MGFLLLLEFNVSCAFRIQIYSVVPLLSDLIFLLEIIITSQLTLKLTLLVLGLMYPLVVCVEQIMQSEMYPQILQVLLFNRRTFS